MLFQVLIVFSLFMGGAQHPRPSNAPETLPIDEPHKLSQAPLIGYDCNKTNPEVLTMSALEVGPCPPLATLIPKTEQIYGQIIQKHGFRLVKVLTCQLTKSQFFFRCAKNWYNYHVYPPTIGKIVNVKPKICEGIHTTGEYNWSPRFSAWTDLEVNQTYQKSVNEIGWTDRLGYCEGGFYDINGQTHTDIVVQTSLTLSIRESWSMVDMDTGKINIENSVQCSYKEGMCNDALSGSHMWVPSSEQCPDEKYVELYKGIVNVTSGSEDGLKILSVVQGSFVFSAELGTRTFTCALSMQLTEFPEIFFLPQISRMYQGKFRNPDQTDIKFITYLNAKMTFSRHSLTESINNVYIKAMLRACEIERDVLKNRIEIIRLTTNSGGLSTLLQGGMFARANGEVIHVLKCEPVPVHLRNTPECFDSLPIIVNNQPKFLLPNTHIISPNASRIPCTPITPLTYRIGGKWWSFTGTYQPVSPPQIISPRGIDKMNFVEIRSFSRGGMYSSEQIEAVQRMFSFPSLREAVTTNVAAGVTGYFGNPIPMDITKIMSDTDMETILQKHMKKWWGVFSSIGNAVSGLIGIYVVYKILKSVVVTLLDVKELYGAFGFSFHLLGACWSRLALYLLNKARDSNSDHPQHRSESPQERNRSQEPIDVTLALKTIYPNRIFPLPSETVEETPLTE